MGQNVLTFHLDANRHCLNLNSSIKTSFTISEIDYLLAITDTDMMDNLVESGIHLDENNIDWYLGADRASFVWTGTIRTENGYIIQYESYYMIHTKLYPTV